MAKVNTYVYVVQDGYPVLLNPGDDIPEGVEVTNPAVLEESDEDAFAGNQEVEPEVTAEDLLSNDASTEDTPTEDDAPEDAPTEDDTPEDDPEDAPKAPAKRAARKAATAAE